MAAGDINLNGPAYRNPGQVTVGNLQAEHFTTRNSRNNLDRTLYNAPDTQYMNQTKSTVINQNELPPGTIASNQSSSRNPPSPILNQTARNRPKSPATIRNISINKISAMSRH